MRNPAIAILKYIEYDLPKSPNVFLIQPILDLLQDDCMRSYSLSTSYRSLYLLEEPLERLSKSPPIFQVSILL